MLFWSLKSFRAVQVLKTSTYHNQESYPDGNKKSVHKRQKNCFNIYTSFYFWNNIRWTTLIIFRVTNNFYLKLFFSDLTDFPESFLDHFFLGTWRTKLLRRVHHFFMRSFRENFHNKSIRIFVWKKLFGSSDLIPSSCV